MKMGDRIRELRTQSNLTQQELADKLGLQKSAIAKYENGRVENIKRSVIQQMADIFEVSPSYVMGLDEERNYYLDEETREMMQEIFENKDLRMLFDASRNAKPEDLKLIVEMAKRFRGEE